MAVSYGVWEDDGQEWLQAYQVVDFDVDLSYRYGGIEEDIRVRLVHTGIWARVFGRVDYGVLVTFESEVVPDIA